MMNATPLQIDWHSQRKERLQRIAARAIQPPKPKQVVMAEPPHRDWLDVATPPEPAPETSLSPLRTFSIDAAIYFTARHFKVSRADIKSARRTAEIVRPRQIAMFLAKTVTLRSLPEIGRRFGGRDHTTVLHAVRKIGLLVKVDWMVAHDVAWIEQEMTNA